jgi:predicted nuclease of predicted toxin-antitoxin system
MHVDAVGLRGRADTEIWQPARDHDFLIVSKDGDFRQLCILRGPPPKFAHLQVGNASTREIVNLLRMRYVAIAEFGVSEDESVLVLT